MPRIFAVLALCLFPVLACLAAPLAALADGGSAGGGGAPACASVAVDACDVLDLSGGNVANLSAPTVNINGFDLLQLGSTETSVEASDALHLHGDASATLASSGTVAVQATGNVSITSITGATVLGGEVHLGSCTLSVVGGVVMCL